ncbi:metallophosphoesterase [Plasticicumulans acidivorans]|uniref:Calcineurin-like phosphoesterase domain-containing protein n=1 Tax=Plasticicumulans acidivorans TaxID=886464 RepID=A0A317MS02_9GAMM|nr:metallophosphoesterase [Plasticicumulans acidivorans]PWV59577.1 hypothetical protein C7443_110122 [Plasticicumulans acidivorans]
MTRRVVRLAVWAFVCGLALWSAGIEPRLLRTRELTLAVEPWPAGTPPLRAVYCSDLHAGSGAIDLAALDHLVARISALQPDLLLLGGDYVNQVTAFGLVQLNIEPVAERLGRVPARYGRFAVLGNHDGYYGAEAVRAALQRHSIRVLDNSAAAAGAVWVAGVADDMTGRPDVRLALRDIPAQAPTLLLTHDPATYAEHPPGLLLALAGHTHGGQITLPGLGALFIPGRAPRRHARGWIDEGHGPMYVTTGIGTSTLPLRLGAVPEIVVLTLQPAAQLQASTSARPGADASVETRMLPVAMASSPSN